MIDFHYLVDFELDNEAYFADWLTRIVFSEDWQVGQLDYIFCSDDYLLQMNRSYLKHDTYTDIITFDYSNGKLLVGDLFVSIERIRENALMLHVGFIEELLRVMAHGVLHLMGYTDKGANETAEMRNKEEVMIKMFHVEQ